jgi:methionyl-tRNA synthetase
VDLRIAKILSAEAVEGADKLLRLKVDVGDGERQIFAGIKSSFQPEDLIGKHIVVVANLAPRKMRFGMSEGMMIVAKNDDSGDLFLVEPQAGAKPGMRVK